MSEYIEISAEEFNEYVDSLEKEIEALKAQVGQLNALIIKMQERATLFLQPDSESESEFVNFIIGILDGPEQRLAQSTPAQCLAEAKAETISRNTSDWYDYEQQKAIALPPVGTRCEVYNDHLDNAEWEECTIRFIGTFKCIYDSESCKERVGDVDTIGALQFRPLDYATRAKELEKKRVVDAVFAVFAEYKYHTHLSVYDVLEMMYDKGFIKLPDQPQAK